MNKKVGITLRGVTLDNIAPNIDKNMMEELLNNRELYSDFMRGFNPNIETVVNLTRERDALKYLLQEYKDLEEQGRLIKLPCKVGAIVYRIANKKVYDWGEVIKFEIYEDEIWVVDDSDNYFAPEDIGKTVFLTREEAEAKLKEMGENV